MGAWGHEVLSNDTALDAMYGLARSGNLKGSIATLLESEYIEEQVLACELVDISLNGISEEILGEYSSLYNEFFEKIKNVPMTDLKPKALTAIKYVQRYDDGWIACVRKEREDLLKKIESRLKS